MVEQTVRLAVNFTVNEGQLEEFTSVARAMTAASQAEPGTLGYEWYASADSKRFRLLEIYVDAAAVEAHFMGPALELVPKIAATCSVDLLEIYGDPGPKVVEMIGGFGGLVYQYQLGLNR
jgi:quinol monooxygenase YgiN